MANLRTRLNSNQNLEQLALNNASLNDLRRRGIPADKIFEYRRVKQRVDNQRKSKARQIDNKIKDLSKFGTVENAKKQLKNIDPNIKRFMTFNEKTIEKKQNQNIDKLNKEIQKLEKDIKQSKEREKKYKERDQDDRVDRQRAREDGYREEKRVLNRYLNDLKQGKLIDTNKILSFARDKGRAEREYEEAKAKQKAKVEKINKTLNSGDITKINYDKGTVVVNGKTLNVGRGNVKDLNLSVVTEAKIKKQQKVLKEISKDPEKAPNISELKKLGFSNKDISDIGKVQKNYREDIKKKNISIASKNALDRLFKKGLIEKQLELNQIEADKKTRESISRVLKKVNSESLIEKNLNLSKKDKQKVVNKIEKKYSNFDRAKNTLSGLFTIATDLVALGLTYGVQKPTEVAVKNLALTVMKIDSPQERKEVKTFLNKRRKELFKDISKRVKSQSVDTSELIKDSLVYLNEIRVGNIKRFKKDILKTAPGVKKVSKFITENSSEMYKDLQKAFDEADIKVSDIKKVKNVDVKKFGKALGNYVPFVNPDSREAWNNLSKGKIKEMDLKERANILFDVTLIYGLTAGTVGKVAIKETIKKQGLKTVPKKDQSKFIKGLTASGESAKNFLTFTSSVISNTGFADRSYKAAQDILEVDNTYLNKIAKKYGEANSTQLYNVYNGFIIKEIDIYKPTPQNIGRLIGLDTADKKTIAKAQAKFKSSLRSYGFTEKEINKTITELEKKRLARVWGQTVGALRTEISSEVMARNLIKKGVGKKSAVGTAGAREGLSFLAQESYIQEFGLDPFDVAGALFFGRKMSLFFSKDKFKPFSQKKTDKVLSKMAKGINKDLSTTKKLSYIKKSVDKLPQDIKDNVNFRALSKKQVNNLSERYIYKSLLKQAKGKGKISLSKQKLMLRDPVANIIDPFELPAEWLLDIKDSVLKKIGINKAKLKKNKSRIKSKSKLSNKSKTKDKTKSKGKSSTKSKLSNKSKSKSKVNTKTKNKTKINTKTKSNTKVPTKSKSKTKTKSKTKSKIKSKTKTKIKTVGLPILPKLKLDPKTKKRLAYDMVYIIDNKPKTIKLNEPLNKALKEASQKAKKSKAIKNFSLKKGGTTKKKDIPKPDLKGFKLFKGYYVEK